MAYMRVHQTWKTKLLLKIRSWHKVTGYLMIFIAQVAVESGIYYYFLMVDKKMAWPLTIANGVTTAILFLAFEIHYRKFEYGREVAFKTPLVTYTKA